jgi:hypothetical protein
MRLRVAAMAKQVRGFRGEKIKDFLDSLLCNVLSLRLASLFCYLFDFGLDSISFY